MTSSDNPADLRSRGVSASVLVNEDQSWHGPDWLSRPASDWPTWGIESQALQEVNSVPSKKCVVFETKLVTLDVDHRHDDPAENPVLGYLLSRASSFSQLLRITGWVQRILQNLRSTRWRKQGSLTPTETQAARLLWVKVLQKQHYAAVIKSLAATQQHPLIHQLDFFLSKDGLLSLL